MSRFDYVKYDENAIKLQAGIKTVVEGLEQTLDAFVPPGKPSEAGRYRALAITALEEFYTWVGKAIKENQIARNLAEQNAKLQAAPEEPAKS